MFKMFANAASKAGASANAAASAASAFAAGSAAGGARGGAAMGGSTTGPNRPAGGGAAGGGDPVKDGTDRSFMADVMEASRTVPVIVDFWATWCGPCKQLGPALEKTVRAAKGAVRLVKIDIDKNPAIASQLRVQSVPTVYAFFQGRPVDAFTGALPESQIKTWVERLIQMTGGGKGAAPSLDDVLAEAAAALEAGDASEAAEIYAEVLQAEPDNAVAYAGLIRCMIATGEVQHARQMLDSAAPELAKAKEVQAVRTTLDLMEQSRASGPIPELMERLARNKDDHQVRYDLAMALFAADKREAAVDELLEIVRRDRTWNDDAARKQLLKFFEAFGPTDKLTVSARRKLSTILFA